MLSSVALYLIDRLGVVGVGVAVFLNGLGVPGLSEVLLPLGGVGVRQGRINAVELVLVAYVCQLAGVTIAYLIAKYGGVALIERYGKYVFISTRELNATHRLFDRYGNGLVGVGAFIPGPQGFVGYVAGIARMPFWKFFAAVMIGKLIWVGGMIYLGYLLGNHLQLLDKLVSQLGAVILIVLVAAAVWYVKVHRKRLAVAGAPQKEN
jgi:membrane protein DedA with SNARE-associated domain